MDILNCINKMSTSKNKNVNSKYIERSKGHEVIEEAHN